MTIVISFDIKKNVRMEIHPNDVKKLRRDLSLTQQKLADLIGVRQHTVARWETGINKPTGACLKALRDLVEAAKERREGK